MAAFDEAGRKTVQDLDQNVRAWIQLLKEAVKELRAGTKIKMTLEFEKEDKDGTVR